MADVPAARKCESFQQFINRRLLDATSMNLNNVTRQKRVNEGRIEPTPSKIGPLYTRNIHLHKFAPTGISNSQVAQRILKVVKASPQTILETIDNLTYAPQVINNSAPIVRPEEGRRRTSVVFSDLKKSNMVSKLDTIRKRVVQHVLTPFEQQTRQCVLMIDSLAQSMAETKTAFMVQQQSNLPVLLSDLQYFSTVAVVKRVPIEPLSVQEARQKLRLILELDAPPYYKQIPQVQTIKNTGYKRKAYLILQAIVRILGGIQEGSWPIPGTAKDEISSQVNMVISKVIWIENIESMVQKIQHGDSRSLFQLNRLLGRIRSFEVMPFDHRIRLCNCFAYVSRRKGAMIIKQGRRPLYVYFLLNGQVKIVKDTIEGRIEQGVLSAGAIFGRPEPLRKQSIVCLTRCEMVQVDISTDG